MLLSGFKEENFTDYRKPSMTVGFPSCDFKCGEWCQNYCLKNSNKISIPASTIIKRYQENPIVKALVCAGLEPFDTFQQLYDLVKDFRDISKDDIVIYTGYNENEIKSKVQELAIFPNIYIKFGRYIPNQSSHYDVVLGVYLASDNQYGKKIS